MGIRYKGSIGSFLGCTESGNPFFPSGRKTCLKLSMKIKFDEYKSEQRFFGVKRLQLHAMRLDDSMMDERLAYSLFREMGIAAPRANHIRLLVNGVKGFSCLSNRLTVNSFDRVSQRAGKAISTRRHGRRKQLMKNTI